MTALPLHVLARHDLISYCQLMDPSFRAPPHIRLIAGKLEQVARGQIKRLIVNLPPRHGKSWLISKFFPSWYMGKFPGRQVLNCTHGGDLSTDFGRDIRDLIEEEEFQFAFPGVRCKQDSKAANRFHITKQGGRERGIFKALTRTGKKSGRGADLLLVDDLLDEMEIYSEAAKEQARRAVRGLRTRIMPGGAIVMIMSRCADDDPVAYALDAMKHEGWEVLALPAIADEPERHVLPDGTEWLRQIGDPLWPEQYSLKALEDLRDGMPLHEWSAKYQRRPIPMGSRLVEEEWFKERRYDDEPDDLIRSAERIVMTADTSKGAATGAETALEVWAELRGGTFLVRMAAERWQVPAILREIKDLCSGLPSPPHIALIEDKSTGEAIIPLLEEDPEWKIPIEPVQPKIDKVIRFAASTPGMKTGHVWLPRRGHPSCPWLPKFEAQFFHYPNCALKDIGDATSQYLNWRRENPLPKKNPGLGWSELSQKLSEGYNADEPIF